MPTSADACVSGRCVCAVACAVLAAQAAQGLRADGPVRGRDVMQSSLTTRSDVRGERDAAEAIAAGPVVGPDIIVSVIDGIANYTAMGAVNNLHAYSVGTTACNIGDAEAVWEDDTNQHPVIALSLFRYANDRFEQIGQSWLKHGFCAVNGANFCEVCQPTNPICPKLGIGCSDTYGPTLNGNPTYLGPKSEVNATTGAFPFPHASPSGPVNLRGRLLAHVNDVDAAQNVDALYFVQAQYVSPDEPAWGTHLNNCASRQCSFDNPAMSIALLGATFPEEPAIARWAALDASVVLTVDDIPGDGRVYVASRVEQVGEGQWSYEYAVFNMNSDRAIGSVAVPVESGAVVSGLGFHDVNYHSGEPYSGANWPASLTEGGVMWSCVPFAESANANAIRWGTLYNFRLTSDAGPASGAITLGLFKPAPELGGPASVTVAATVPGATEAPSCLGDMVSSATFQPPPDGAVNGADLAFLLGEWGANPGSLADLVTSATFQPPADGLVNGADLAYMLGAWGTCE